MTDAPQAVVNPAAAVSRKSGRLDGTSSNGDKGAHEHRGFRKVTGYVEADEAHPHGYAVRKESAVSSASPQTISRINTISLRCVARRSSFWRREQSHRMSYTLQYQEIRLLRGARSDKPLGYVLRRIR